MSEPIHSPLGASSAERWMNCPGSNSLRDKLHILEGTDEPDYRAEGIATHEVAAHCLEQGLDTWEIVGLDFHGIKATAEMADAVQVYLDYVRPFMEPSATIMIEKRIGEVAEKRPHPLFYGTVDFAAYGTDTLRVTDYKNGAGIVVEPEWNVQMMYYAYGIICDRPKVRDDREVILAIVQPNAFHVEGPIREWATTAGEIKEWAERELLPAMNNAELDATLEPGPWCRFCPAKLVCPMLTALFGAAARANPSEIVNLSDESLGRSYQYTKGVEFYLKAMKDETFNRLSHGREVPGTKLVHKQSHRVYNAGADELAKEMFGEEAFTKPELKSPSQIEALGPAGKKFAKEHAYHPDTGLTVDLASSKKPGVKVEKTETTFAAAIAALPSSGTEGDSNV